MAVNKACDSPACMSPLEPEIETDGGEAKFKQCGMLRGRGCMSAAFVCSVLIKADCYIPGVGTVDPFDAETPGTITRKPKVAGLRGCLWQRIIIYREIKICLTLRVEPDIRDKLKPGAYRLVPGSMNSVGVDTPVVIKVTVIKMQGSVPVVKKPSVPEAEGPLGSFVRSHISQFVRVS